MRCLLVARGGLWGLVALLATATGTDSPSPAPSPLLPATQSAHSTPGQVEKSVTTATVEPTSASPPGGHDSEAESTTVTDKVSQNVPIVSASSVFPGEESTTMSDSLKRTTQDAPTVSLSSSDMFQRAASASVSDSSHKEAPPVSSSVPVVKPVTDSSILPQSSSYMASQSHMQNGGMSPSQSAVASSIAPTSAGSVEEREGPSMSSIVIDSVHHTESSSIGPGDAGRVEGAESSVMTDSYTMATQTSALSSSQIQTVVSSVISTTAAAAPTMGTGHTSASMWASPPGDTQLPVSSVMDSQDDSSDIIGPSVMASESPVIGSSFHTVAVSQTSTLLETAEGTMQSSSVWMTTTEPTTEPVPPCNLSPCQHNATCLETGNQTYVCECPPGVTGLNCETDIDECVSAPCMNGGSCEDLTNSYRCHCSELWTGSHCENDIDECTKDVDLCDVNAKCTNVIGGYNCTCEPGYSGDGRMCEFMNLCDSSPCVHGYCKSEVGAYECKCLHGWANILHSNCSEDVDECVEPTLSDCHPTLGECVNNPGGHFCRCQPGAVGDGKSCEIKPNVSDTLYPYKDSQFMALSPSFSVQSDYNLGLGCGLPLFGRLNTHVKINANGYLAFYGDPKKPAKVEKRENPVGPHMFPKDRLILAPYWTDLDQGEGSGWYEAWTSHQSGAAWSDLESRVMKDVKQYSGEDIKPYLIGVVTYTNMTAFPLKYYGSETAKFQVVYVTDCSKSFAMFNYEVGGMKWKSSNGTIVLGYSDGANNEYFLNVSDPHRPDLDSNVGVPGRWFFKVGDDVRTESESRCVDWYFNQRAMKREARLYHCPCTREQAMWDPVWVYNETSGCASVEYAASFINSVESKMASNMTGDIEDSVRNLCCYDPSEASNALHVGYPDGGYLVYDGKEAQYHDECCKSPETCNYFYWRRPSDTCRKYPPVMQGLLWGSSHLMTFGGDVYSLKGTTEVVLVQDGSLNSSVMVQVRLENRTVSDSPLVYSTVVTKVAVKVCNICMCT